ncbi:putative gustatory receptor 93c isoform X2 [Musca autumnalis]
MQQLEEFQPNYKLFRWIHVALLALKLSSFIYEIVCIGHEVYISMDNGDLYSISLVVVEMYLMVTVWLSLHMISISYICVEALLNSLTHYVRQNLIPRIRDTRHRWPASQTDLENLKSDLQTFSNLLIRIQRNALDLHKLWQLLILTTILFIYCGTTCVIYYTVWQYYEDNQMHTRYIVFILKLLFDVGLLSLTGHRAVSASQLVGIVGFDNSAAMNENEEWNREIELFLHRIQLNEFKLNVFGLFYISNTLTLAFISGILTSISIFIPFSIKTYRVQQFLHNWNSV